MTVCKRKLSDNCLIVEDCRNSPSFLAPAWIQLQWQRFLTCTDTCHARSRAWWRSQARVFGQHWSMAWLLTNIEAGERKLSPSAENYSVEFWARFCHSIYSWYKMFIWAKARTQYLEKQRKLVNSGLNWKVGTKIFVTSYPCLIWGHLTRIIHIFFNFGFKMLSI